MALYRDVSGRIVNHQRILCCDEHTVRTFENAVQRAASAGPIFAPRSSSHEKPDCDLMSMIAAYFFLHCDSQYRPVWLNAQTYHVPLVFARLPVPVICHIGLLRNTIRWLQQMSCQTCKCSLFEVDPITTFSTMNCEVFNEAGGLFNGPVSGRGWGWG